MRRLVSVLAAGLLAAGTVLTAAGAASAGPAPVPRPDCEGAFYFWVTAGSVNYYPGTPNKLSSGAAAILKPNQNSTTFWAGSATGADVVLLLNRGLALTSRASTPGADVTMEPLGNGGKGFASQQWVFAFTTSPPTFTFQNVKTGLWLRVRNGGPVIDQTVTTGRTPTTWSTSL